MPKPISPCRSPRSPNPSVSFPPTNRLIDHRSLSRAETNTSRWRVRSTPQCVFASDHLLFFIINFCSSLRRRSMFFCDIFSVIRLASVISSSKKNTRASPSWSAGTWSDSYSPPVVAKKKSTSCLVVARHLVWYSDTVSFRLLLLRCHFERRSHVAGAAWSRSEDVEAT